LTNSGGAGSSNGSVRYLLRRPIHITALVERALTTWDIRLARWPSLASREAGVSSNDTDSARWNPVEVMLKGYVVDGPHVGDA
jgi:hypothetical protein